MTDQDTQSQLESALEECGRLQEENARLRRQLSMHGMAALRASGLVNASRFSRAYSLLRGNGKASQALAAFKQLKKQQTDDDQEFIEGIRKDVEAH